MKSIRQQRGAATMFYVALMATVLSGFIVMAVDVGRYYLIQGELQTAADAAALAAATQLNGTINAQSNATAQMTSALDNSTGNDNRFNLRQNQLGSGASGLVATTTLDFFSTRLDALGNQNGSQTGSSARYARVQVTAQTPTLFARLLDPSFGPIGPTVAAAAVAGISAPVCTACGIDSLAVVAPSTDETSDYGFVVGQFYTFYLTTTQQTLGPSCTASTPSPLTGTVATLEYVALDHDPNGLQGLDPDGNLFELGAGGMNVNPPADTTTPGSIAVGTPDTALTGTYTSCPGQDFICGLNTRFGVDPSGDACGTLAAGEFVSLAPLFTSDTDVGVGSFAAGVGLQDYATEYGGNLRRLLTVAVVDASDSLNVLNFRQFLIETSPTVNQGLDPSLTTGAFPAQYLGAPAPIRCAAAAGSCTIVTGVGRTVLH